MSGIGRQSERLEAPLPLRTHADARSWREGTDEALYLARSVCRACSHSTLGQVLLVSTLAGAGRLWEAQTEAEQAYVGAVSRRRGARRAARVRVRAAGQAERGGVYAAGAGSLGAAKQPGASGRARARWHAQGTRSQERRQLSLPRRRLERAAAAYSAALDVDVEGCLTPTLLANRAQARLSAERLPSALADCDGAIARRRQREVTPSARGVLRCSPPSCQGTRGVRDGA